MNDPYAAYGGTSTAAPAAAATDPYAAYGGSSAPGTPAPANNALTTGSITDNPNGEGIYRMVGPDGKQVGVPYTKAKSLGKPQGYTFVDQNEAHRFMKDYIADPAEQQKMVDVAKDDPGLNMFLGLAKHALRTLYGIGDITSGGQTLQGTEFKPTGKSTSPVRQFAEEPDQNIHETIGGTLEDTGEFISGERFLKLLPELAGAQKLEVASRLAKLAEKHPLIANALRNAAVAGAQTDVKTGGDLGSAATAAAVTGAGSAALEGIGTKVGGALAKRATTLENVGGVETPVPAEVRNAKQTPQQTAGQEVIRGSAQDTLRGHLEEVNESRAVNPRGGMPADPGEMTEYFRTGTGPNATWAERRVPATPHFAPVDVPRAIRQVGSHSDAAQQLLDLASDGYNSMSDALDLNGVSGGKFAAIRQANKNAWRQLTQATSAEERAVAETAVDHSNEEMTQLLKDVRGSVSPKELDGFDDAYRAGQRLQYVGNAIDSSFTGNTGSSARRSFEYVGFDGGKLMLNLRRLEGKFGRPGLERLLGRGNLDTLYQVAELNRTGAQRSRFGADGIKPVASWLQEHPGLIQHHLAPMAVGAGLGHLVGLNGYAGALAGETVAYTARRVMAAVLTNPRIAQNLIFAIQSGAKPENYAPLIGTMIQKYEAAQARERQQPQQTTEDNTQ